MASANFSNAASHNSTHTGIDRVGGTGGGQSGGPALVLLPWRGSALWIYSVTPGAFPQGQYPPKLHPSKTHHLSPGGGGSWVGGHPPNPTSTLIREKPFRKLPSSAFGGASGPNPPIHSQNPGGGSTPRFKNTTKNKKSKKKYKNQIHAGENCILYVNCSRSSSHALLCWRGQNYSHPLWQNF